MIKNYIIDQANLSATASNMITKGVDGYIVCAGNRRIYYQSKAAGSVPVLIGTSNYWTVLNNSGTDRQTLEVGKKYVRTGSNPNYNLPASETGLTSGDTIEFYNKNQSAFNIQASNNPFVNVTTTTSGQYYKFYWDGSAWQTLSVVTDNLYATSANVSSIITSYGYQTASNVTDSISGASGAIVTAATGWVDAQNYLTSITSGDITTALDYTPTTSANVLSIVSSFYDNHILTSNSDAVVSASVKPWVASSCYLFITGYVNNFSKPSKIASGTNTRGAYNLQFVSGEVQVVTITGSNAVNLTCSDLPSGYGMIIKVINPSGTAVSFAGVPIIDSEGNYSFSLFNFGSVIERIGEVILIPSGT